MPDERHQSDEARRDTTERGYDFEHPLHKLGAELFRLRQESGETDLKIDYYGRSRKEDLERGREDLAIQWGTEIRRLERHKLNEDAMTAAGEAYPHAVEYRYTPGGERYFIADDVVGTGGEKFDIVGCKAGFFRVYDGVLEDGVDLERVIDKLQVLTESADFPARRTRAEGMSNGFVQLSLTELGLSQEEIARMPKAVVANGVSIKPYDLANEVQFEALNQSLSTAEQRVLGKQ